MRRLILGTAGHIDHGKTTLVRALTGTDTDRLPEERRRGITIDLGFANLRLDPGIELGVVDVPGHDAFVRNMLAGATGIDLVLLVVAADEGVMPQTREHLAIVELLGVRAGVVALTKVDLVEPEWLELVVDELRTALADSAFAGAPIVPVSGATGAGLEDLRAALAGAAGSIADRTSEDLFRMPIDRVFTVRGTGTVVTGTVWSGSAAREQIVRVLPGGETARIRGVQVHGAEVDAARAGQRAALALAGLERGRIERGAMLVIERAWESAAMLTTRLRLLPASPPLRTRQRVRFHLGTTEVMGRVVLLERTELGPGLEGWAQLRLEAPVTARAGDRFVIRSYSPVTTIGGGIVAEPRAPKRKRLAPAERADFDAVVGGGEEAALEARLRAAAWQGVEAERLPLELPMPPARVAAALLRLAPPPVRVGERLVGRVWADQAREAVTLAARRFHEAQPLRPGADREELRRALPPHAAAGLADWAIEGLLAQGQLVARGGLLALAEFAPSLSSEQERVRAQLLEAIRGPGLSPPTLPELPASLRSRKDFWPLLKLLETEGRLVAVTSDLYFGSDALEQATRDVQSRLAGRGPLGPADFREVLAVSRKYLIPVLEYFDRRGVTLRKGDERFVRQGPAGAAQT